MPKSLELEIARSLTCYAKDIRNLGEPEIKAYIQAPSKRLPKLLLGYQSAMDPKNWLREEELAALKSNSTLNVGRGSTNAESSMSTFRTKRNRNDTIIVGKGSDSSDDSEVLDSGRSAKKAKTSTNTDKTVNCELVINLNIRMVNQTHHSNPIASDVQPG